MQRAVSSSSAKFWYWPLLVPPLYLFVVFAIQPATQLGPPPNVAWLNRELYDDFDTTAMALRGLNASLGRRAGRFDQPPLLSYVGFEQSLDTVQDLQPRYFLEYPHAALLLFRVPYLFDPDDGSTPPGLLDGSHNNVHNHVPRNEAEARVWARLRRAIRWYNVVMALCLVLLMVVLAYGYKPGRLPGRWDFLLLPGALYFSLWRFDVIPALLTAVSLACLGRRWIYASGSVLAAAVLVKVYPILLAPLLLRYLYSSAPRQALRWLGTFVLTLVAVLLTTVALVGWEETLAPYRFQLGRPPEFGWTAYRKLLPGFLAEAGLTGSCFRLGSVAITVLVLCFSRPPDLASVLRRAALILLVFVNVQVFYSPQWILWLSPLLLPLARNNRPLLIALVALDLITYVSFPIVFDSSNHHFSQPAVVYGRFLILMVLFVVISRDEMGSSRQRLELPADAETLKRAKLSLSQ